MLGDGWGRSWPEAGPSYFLGLRPAPAIFWQAMPADHAASCARLAAVAMPPLPADG